jgi:hypothetical protein
MGWCSSNGEACTSGLRLRGEWLVPITLGIASQVSVRLVRGAGRHGTASGYLMTAVLMCTVPLMMLGALAYYLFRQATYDPHRQRERVPWASPPHGRLEPASGKTLQTNSFRQSAQIARSSVQQKLHGNRHPHGDRLPTPAGRLEAPAPHGVDRRLVEIRMPR